MRKIRWGVLGVAKIAVEKVIPAMQGAEYSEVVAIASRSPQKAKDAAGRLGLAKGYGSYDELLADGDIDAVYNPPETRLIREAREAGCKTVSGITWFVNQAALQFELWTGRPAPRDAMERVLRERLSRLSA